MIQLPAGTRVYLACRPTDMRKGFNGLSAEVANVLQNDPYSSHVFVFRGKRGDYVKVLQAHCIPSRGLGRVSSKF